VEWAAFLWYVVLVGAGSAATVGAVFRVWHLRGRWQIRPAGPRRLIAIRHRVWREPTLAEATDLRFGPGGADGVPMPPFRARSIVDRIRQIGEACGAAAPRVARAG
jgi:hypothetical protein